MPKVFKIGSYWVYFWANENDPKSGSRGPGNAICATTIPTFRPVFCETSWPSSKHEAMK